jgi:cobaltochelatase CobN
VRPRLLILSTSDTDLLAAHQAGAWRVANPARLGLDDLPELLDGTDLVVVRLLGGRQAWPEGLDVVLASRLPVLVTSGESAPDAALQALSTVPAGVTTEALRYLVEGGVTNLRELAAFLQDTVLLDGQGFEPPQAMPQWGVHTCACASCAGICRGGADGGGGRPVVGIVFYRAHELSGNTAFVDALCRAVVQRGGRPVPVFCGSLRGLRATDPDAAGLLDLLSGCDVLITTVLASGGTVAASASAGGDEEAWDAGALAGLDVPVLQGLALTSSRQAWLASDAAVTPLDATIQVAIPEFDGRLIGVPFSFKEAGDGPVPLYVADPERCLRLAGIAVALGRLRHLAAGDRRIALVLSSYPTKHARIGNAVGLDTPASAVVLLQALADAGYDVGGGFPLDGDALIHALVAAGGHDVEWLTQDQLANAVAKVPGATYQGWFDELPGDLRESMTAAWGPPPGSLYIDDSGPDPQLALAALRFGNVVLMIQPPRGFGENPVAIYHDPNLAPSHHYLGAYRWLAAAPERGGFGAHAVVHLGKHGTLEWLPGKGIGLSASCGPDAVLGDLPLVYPFIVNDPGEGTQAKRRAHAVVVDHLVPPMARAEIYGDMAKLEQLLDEYATVVALDPAKAPVLRQQIWTVVQSAQLHQDLHLDEVPDAETFDDFVLHVDGYLCEIKDVQIRDGLHVLGQGPVEESRVNLVLAVLRANQVWGGQTQAFPGLRSAIAGWVGLVEASLLREPGALMTGLGVRSAARLADLVGGPSRTGADVVDLLEGLARRLVTSMDELGWAAERAGEVCVQVLGEKVSEVVRVLEFGATEVVPRLARTGDEVTNVLHALAGGYVPAGPSGSPTRGLVNVLPTGRNFYAVDPKAIPSRTAWDTGVALAESLMARYLADTGDYPRSVGLSVWGTACMRTQGDDVAELLWLLGVRPVWDDASRRVTGLEVVSLAELARPRVDVTIRISGFFRDAFPHVVTMLDDAVQLVADLDESDDENFVRAHVAGDLSAGVERRRATARVFGSKPGGYGAGLLPLVDARSWQSDADLAEVYAVWGGYAYGRELDGAPARGDMERTYARMQVAAKNQDNREHDIVDSDDYFQYHGGMVAMVRQLTGVDPAAYVGDSVLPDQVRTRTLGEETKRVFRSRVVNPRWIAAMQRHGYKGAFEMAATVDYLFGFDATAGVVDDWMYETLTREYVQDPQVAAFMKKSNPWARQGIAERLVEAAQRGLWAEPSPEALAALQDAILETEGDLEGRE